MKKENGQGHNRNEQNARDVWAGPFTAGECDVNTEGGRDGAAVFDATGEPFALFDADTCVRGKDGAMLRAAWLAETLNTRQQPAQTEVPMGDMPPLDDTTQQLLDDVLCVGSALALAQSLKAMAATAAEDGREGHAVVARRAERFVRVMHMQVTRLLQMPDLRLRHVAIPFDLLAAHVDVSDGGKVTMGCTDLDGSGWHTVLLAEAFIAGPVNDMVRVITAEMAKAVVQETIGQAIKRGGMPGLVALAETEALGYEVAMEHHAVGFEPPPGDEAFEPVYSLGENGEVTATRPDGGVTVHHLTVHDSYVMGGDGRTVPE